MSDQHLDREPLAVCCHVGEDADSIAFALIDDVGVGLDLVVAPIAAGEFARGLI